MTRNRIGRTCALIALTGTIACAPVLMGCASSEGPVSSRAADLSGATEEYVSDEKEEVVTDDGSTAPEDAQQDEGAVVIRSASVSLRTRSYDDALASVRKIVSEADGTIVNSYEAGGYGRSITIESRVDPAKLEEAVERLRTLEGCTVLSADVTSSDVTRTYNDTERRIEILNEQYEHYKRMLEEATTTEDMLLISDRMYDVLAEIRSYTDQRDDMRHDADRSQLRVTIEEELTEGTPKASTNIYLNAWDDSWGFFGEAIRALILLVIFLVPFALLVLAILALVLGIRRARRRRHRASGAEPKKVEPEKEGGQPDASDGQDDSSEGRPRPPLS